MADYELSVGLDASQAIQASDKLSTVLKKVDTATAALAKSLNYTHKDVYRKLASETRTVRDATKLLASSFSDFRTLRACFIIFILSFISRTLALYLLQESAPSITTGLKSIPS